MQAATTCIYNGEEISITEALRLRETDKEIVKRGEFTCISCGEQVRTHEAGGHVSAHFEHLSRNVDCPLSHQANQPVKKEESTGGVWTYDELKAATVAYLGMLADELDGKPINKAAVRRSLKEEGEPLHGRSDASIEYRMQNISAVLEGLGLPRIKGYRPAKNVGSNTVEKIVAVLDELGHVARQDYEPTADDEELAKRTKALRKKGFSGPPKGKKKPKRVTSTNHQTFERDAAVRAYVLEQAKGICELCGQPGPFETADGDLFLEVHHVVPLAKDGPDTVDNAVAICPNCHRRCHLSADRDEAVEELYSKVGRLRKAD